MAALGKCRYIKIDCETEEAIIYIWDANEPTPQRHIIFEGHISQIKVKRPDLWERIKDILWAWKTPPTPPFDCYYKTVKKYL